MTAATGVSFRHFTHHARLECMFRQKIEAVVNRRFRSDDYRLLARFNRERPECTLEVDLHVYSRRLHVAIKKVGVNFGQTVGEMARTLKQYLGREKRCGLRRKRRQNLGQERVDSGEAPPLAGTS